jgi:DNA helicase-2/ATP-dependent DNA helicase PcrA
MTTQLLLHELNPRQREAVEHIDGPLLVLSGAGSGKTRVITYRLAHLVLHHGVSPSRILAVTFTNKAAQEMKERIGRLIGREPQGLWVGTFHALSLRMLRRHAALLGFPSDFPVYDASDQWSLFRECVRELNINEDLYPVQTIGNRISRLKNQLITPEIYAGHAQKFGVEEKVLQVYTLYQKKLARTAMDFDDLLMKSVQLLEDYPEVLAAYQEQFQYILVDEYQDTNPVQYRWIQLLASARRNLCVVGDDDQGIYRFRGADIRNILSFERDYPDAKVVTLDQNYRSTQRILDVAGAVVHRNIGRRDKRLWTENPQGEAITYYRAKDERGEAVYACRTLQDLSRRGRALADFCILYRVNAQSRVLEETLRNLGIPYLLVGGVRFYERREVKDVLAYLRVIQNPDDPLSLRRIINAPPRGIGTTTVERLEEFAKTRGVSLYRAIQEAGDAGVFNQGVLSRLKTFRELIEGLREAASGLSPAPLVEKVLEATGYSKMLQVEADADGPRSDAQGRLENVKELITAARSFEERNPDRGFRDFLDEASLFQHETGRDREGASSTGWVTLMTLHSAKGLEFPVVFIAGFEDGLLPHIRARHDDEELAEERRLCYVGITRAKEKLYLLSAVNRHLYGTNQYNPESRFLREVQGEGLETVSWDQYGDQRGDQSGDSGGAAAGSDRWEGHILIDKNTGDRDNTLSRMLSAPMRERAGVSVSGSASRAWSSGSRVRHPLWGVGIVKGSEGDGDDAKLTVRFDTVGMKKLAVRYAKLERV